jgi:hypothetical protein
MRPLFVERRRDAKLRIAAKIRCRTVLADVGVRGGAEGRVVPALALTGATRRLSGSSWNFDGDPE